MQDSPTPDSTLETFQALLLNSQFLSETGLLRINAATLRRIPSWIWLARYFFLTSFITMAALFYALRSGSSEQLIRLTGLALQLLGGVTVMWTIAETRASFGHDSIMTKSIQWLRAFPLLRQPPIQLHGGTTLMNATMRAYGHLRRVLPDDASTEERIAHLSEEFEQLYSTYWKHVEATDMEFSRMDRQFREASEAHYSEVRILKRELEDTATGGLHIPAIGAVWIIVGSILSTASPEIQRWVN